MTKSRGVLLLFFVLGLFFRFLMIIWVPQPFVFDQVEYHNFALDILQKGLAAWSFRLYGYPLFLAFVYKIFGTGNFIAVYIIQSIIDTATGLLVFLISKKLFKRETIAWISFLIYLFNPFTSAYSGVLLTEVLTIFLVTFTAYLLFSITTDKDSGVKFYFLTLLLGFIPQVRPAFLFFSVAVLVFLIIFTIRRLEFEEKVSSVVLAMCLFILPFIYNIAGNWFYFRQLSLLTVDDIAVKEFYISLYVPYDVSVRLREQAILPNEVRTIYSEYDSKPKDAMERKTMAAKYLNLSFRKIESNVPKFIVSFFKKTVTVWEKHSFYTYTQEKNEIIIFSIYWLNNLLLFFSIYGFLRWILIEHKFSVQSLWWIFLVCYISTVYAFSAAHERYSLPAYPIAILFAGYGLWLLWVRIYSQIKK